MLICKLQYYIYVFLRSFSKHFMNILIMNILEPPSPSPQPTKLASYAPDMTLKN